MRAALVACVLLGCGHPQPPPPPSQPLSARPAPPPHFVVRTPRPGEFTGSRDLGIHRDQGGALRVTASATHLLGTQAQSKLKVGKPIEIVWRVQLTGMHDNKPRAVAVFGCRIQFDLFGEIFRIDFAPPAPSVSAVNLKAVMRRCLVLDEYPLTVVSALSAGKPYRVVAVAEIDAQQPTFATVTSPTFTYGPLTTTSPAVARAELTGIFVP